MRRGSGKVSALVLTCAGFLGVAGFGGVVAGLNVQAGRSAHASPADINASAAEVIAARFPSIEAAVARPAIMNATATLAPDDLMLFSPVPLTPPEPAAIDSGASPVSPAEPDARPAAKRAIAKAEPSAPSAAPRRAANRPGNVLNDAQIASIRQRLNLTPDQEQLWPAVEAALRKVVYAKNAATAPTHVAQLGAAAMAYVDANSAEVQQLKYAALPLIMRLNDDQKREVKSMAHVMGLENMASQF